MNIHPCVIQCRSELDSKVVSSWKMAESFHSQICFNIYNLQKFDLNDKLNLYYHFQWEIFSEKSMQGLDFTHKSFHSQIKINAFIILRLQKASSWTWLLSLSKKWIRLTNYFLVYFQYHSLFKQALKRQVCSYCLNIGHDRLNVALTM